MFDHNSFFGNLPILFFVLLAKCLASKSFFGLYDDDSLRRKSLIAGILSESCTLGEIELFFITDFFVMDFAFIARTEIENLLMIIANEVILYRVGFFFSTVLLLLSSLIHSPLHLSFAGIKVERPWGFSPEELMQLLRVSARIKAHLSEALLQKTTESTDPNADFGLRNAKAGSMILLSRILFEVDQQKEQLLFTTGQTFALVDFRLGVFAKGSFEGVMTKIFATNRFKELQQIVKFSGA